MTHWIYNPGMKKGVLLLLLILVLLFVVGGALLYWSGGSQRVQAVRTVQVGLTALHSNVDTNGTVEADRVLALHAPFPGICSRILVKEGDVLMAGAAILSIDDNAVRVELSAARSELEAAQLEMRNVRRGPSAEEIDGAEAEITRYRFELEAARKNLVANQWLLERNAIARFEVEQSQRQVDVAQHALTTASTRRDDLKARYDADDLRHATARVDAAKGRVGFLEENLSRAVVRAPISGTLYQFKLKEGAYSNTGDLIGLMADLSRLRVRAFVDEVELGRVSVGEAVTIRWDAHPDRSWKAKVQLIPSEIVARGSRSVAEVLCRLTDAPGLLIPNVNVDIEIVANQAPKVISLPRTAIIPDGRNQAVWLVKQGKAEKRPIETGQGTSQLIEIISGLSVGDQVILPGEDPITEGMRIRVTGQ
jgi:HlyD family secretion protein